jgi:hypothetical protein
LVSHESARDEKGGLIVTTNNGAEIVQEAFRRGVEAARAIVEDELAQIEALLHVATHREFMEGEKEEAQKIRARIDVELLRNWRQPIARDSTFVAAYEEAGQGLHAALEAAEGGSQSAEEAAQIIADCGI